MRKSKNIKLGMFEVQKMQQKKTADKRALS